MIITLKSQVPFKCQLKQINIKNKKKSLPNKCYNRHRSGCSISHNDRASVSVPHVSFLQRETFIHRPVTPALSRSEQMLVSSEG